MKYFPFAILKVAGNSMVPTLKPGQFVLVSPLPYLFSAPRINNLVVLNQNNIVMVKRIQKIEADKYFVMGDNLTESTDSRKFGLINRKQILAKVLF